MNAAWQTLHLVAVEPLGWMVLHSVWQLACLAAVFAVVRRWLRQSKAQIRYAVAGVTLGLMVILPAATFVAFIPQLETSGHKLATVIDDGGFTLTDSPTLSEPIDLVEPPEHGSGTMQRDVTPFEHPLGEITRPKTTLTSWIEPCLPWIVVVWAVGVVVLSIWNLGGWIAVQRMTRMGIRSAAPSIERSVNQLKGRLKVSRAVRVVESFLVQTPSVIGWLRPVILLPAGLVTGLTPSQLEAVLAHELAHVRRLDYLANLLQTVVETLFYYHPAVHYISAQMRAEREYCADELALAIVGDKVAYAKTLREIAERIEKGVRNLLSISDDIRHDVAQKVPDTFFVAATDGHLGDRVRRLFGLATHDGGRTGSWLIGAAVSLVVLAGLVAVPTVRAAFVATEAPQVAQRRVWADARTGSDGRISPDGRYIAYINWGNGNLALHDLDTGENRELTTTGGWEPPGTWAECPLWSPDSRQIAYAWYVGPKQDLRVVSIDGGEPRAVVEGGNEGDEYAYPLDWMPDGKRVLAGGDDDEGRSFHALFDVSDGTMHRLPDSPHNWDTASISPDGEYVAYDSHGGGPEQDIYLFNMATGESNPIVLHPADDRFPLFSRNGKWLTFVSTRGGDRGAWMIPFADGLPAGEPRRLAPGLTVTQPMGLTDRGVYAASLHARQNNIHQVGFDPDSDTAAGTPHLLVQRFEGRNSMPTWSPDGSKLAFISARPAPSGGSRLSVVVRDEATGREAYPPIDDPILSIRTHLAWRKDNKTLLIRMVGRGTVGQEHETEGPFQHWLLAWNFETGRLTPLVTWAAIGYPQISYAFDVSPDDAFFYYATRDEQGTVRIVRRRLGDGQETNVTTIRDAGLVDSLALSPYGSRLAVLESSAIYFVDLASGEHEVAYRAKNDSEAIRSGMTWTVAGDYLLFAQGVRGGQPRTTLMRIPAAGGQPQPAGLSMARIGRPAMHPTGRHLAFDGGPSPYTNEVWIVENSLLMGQTEKGR